MDKGFISSSYLLSLLRILEGMGFSREQSMEAGGLDSAALYNPKSRIPMDGVLDILNASADALEEPNIGLQVGYRFRVHTFTETGSILALCGTLAEAAQINAMYQPLAETLGKQSFQRGEDGAFIVWDPSFEDADAGRHVTELVMAGYATTTNWLSWGYERGVDRIDLMHAAPDSLEGYEKVFGPRIRFSQPRNALRFNDATVDKPLPMSNPEKLAQVRQRLDFIMSRAQQKSGLREKVAGHILSGLQDQNVSFGRIARDMGLAERTLRRSLSEENLNYRSILESVRKQLCDTYMRDGRSLTEIAHLLGYNDQSAFTRAFKGWYGVKPSEYRPEPISL